MAAVPNAYGDAVWILPEIYFQTYKFLWYVAKYFFLICFLPLKCMYFSKRKAGFTHYIICWTSQWMSSYKLSNGHLASCIWCLVCSVSIHQNLWQDGWKISSNFLKLKMANNVGNGITKILGDETASSVTMLGPSVLMLNSLFVFLKHLWI